MRRTFEELVDDLENLPSTDLERIAELARSYAIEKRREEIAFNLRTGREEWRSGTLVPSDDIDHLMQSLDDV